MAEKEYTPWSRESEDGLITSAVDSHVSVSQNVVPALNVGIIDKLSGKWEGVTVSDSLFLVDPTHEGVADGAKVLSPQKADHEYIDMTGFNEILIAFKVSNTGNYGIEAIMGPQQYPFANLQPVNAATTLRGISGTLRASEYLYADSAEALTADVWNIFIIGLGRLKGQKVFR